MGYDAGKQVKGRKIRAVVDSEGLPMGVVVHAAAIQDRDRAGLVSAQYSLAGAVGLIKSGLSFVLIVIAYWLANRFSGYRIF